MSRRARLWVAFLAATSLLTACSSTFGMPPGGDAQGQDITSLWKVFFWASVGVASIVYGLIFWSLIRYRRRGRTDTPPQFREHRALEITYTAIPILIVGALFVMTMRTEGRVLALSPNPDVTVHVEGYTWGWRFSYEGSDVVVVSAPDGNPPELVLPEGQTTRIVLTSQDVIHAFYVPGFLFKRDAIPGRTSEFQFSPDRTGTYQGECAEFCGLNHAFMRFTVRVVSGSDYASWISQQQAAQLQAGSPSPSPAAGP
jgi:cytochrome c oxidase subunit 2